jgi:CheY-like chemotaxis protein
MPEARRTDRARLAALIVEALDRIATPTARYEVLDRALMLAKRDSLPTQAGELLEFVDGPLHQAVLAILDGDAAELLHEHLGVLIARAGYEANAPRTAGPNTLPPPTPTPASDVVPASSRRGSGAYVKPHATRRQRKTAGGDWRHSTLGYNASTLMGESTGKERVVVVDDDPGYRRALVRLLDAVGYEVNAAPNVDTALWMCEKLRPDLVVTDYELGESNGVALAGEINRRMGDEAPPIILVTASAALPKLQSGIARVMVKSVNDDSIVGAAAELISKHRK